MNTRSRPLPLRWLPVVVVAAATGAALHAADRITDTPADFLTTWNLDRTARAEVEQAGPWDVAKLPVCLRLLARLALAPPDAYATWTAAAMPAPAALPGPGDAFVQLEGRAVFVAPLTLPADQAEIANRPTIDVVRIDTAAGLVDVIADAVPKAWQRWQPIDEPVSVVGLPVSNAAGPRPEPPAGTAATWPADPAGLLMVARRVAWHPATPLGSLGMDYGLFDSVVDGQRLVAGDTDAFYALLGAVGRGTQTAIETAAGPVADAVPLIDPGRKWFATHRGDAVTFQGTARRATRIQIDEPRRRREIGGDHYWELYVFVPTSLIKINERVQDTYPIVCCVRDLPEGMPTGQSINEPVRVSGFAMKRYAYPLPKVQGQEDGGTRQETPLVVGKQAIWVPEPSATQATSILGWVFLTLAGIVALVLAFGAWRFNRDARLQRQRQRAALPDKLELP
ncbi:MAG: hypothetical protein WCR51_14480 [Planctomycetia bacterium]